MAVDTAQKRAALISFISPFPYPIPIAGDGTVDAIDRAALAGLYVDSDWVAPPANNAPVEDSPIGTLNYVNGQTVNENLANHFSDPDGDNLSFAVQSGTLPGNLSLSSAGILSGTLDGTDEAGSPYANIVIRVTDDAGSPLYVDSTAFTINVLAPGGNIAWLHDRRLKQFRKHRL